MKLDDGVGERNERVGRKECGFWHLWFGHNDYHWEAKLEDIKLVSKYKLDIHVQLEIKWNLIDFLLNPIIRNDILIVKSNFWTQINFILMMYKILREEHHFPQYWIF